MMNHSIFNQLIINATLASAPTPTRRPTTIEYIFPCVGFFISSYAFLANLRLLYRQKSLTAWFDEDRPLIIGVLLANSLSSLAHVCLFILTLGQKSILINIDLTNLQWISAVGDAGATISIFYVATIAFRGYYNVKGRCQSSTFQAKISRYNHLVHLAHLFWPIAFVLALFGLNADNSSFLPWIKINQLISDIGYYSTIIILHVLIMFIVYETKKYIERLQHDFVVNRAQQSLQTRVSLNRTIKRIEILIPQLIIHVLLWIILLIANFIYDCVVDTNAIDGLESNSAWPSFMDCVEAVIYAIYPMLLTRKPGNPLKKQFLQAILCRYDLKDGQATSQMQPIAMIGTIAERKSGTAGVHWQAIDQLWVRIENSKGKKNTSGTAKVDQISKR